MGAMEAFACHQAKKIVATLEVASGAKGESADSARSHGVVVFFVGLDILSILNAAMLVVVNDESGDDGLRTQSL